MQGILSAAYAPGAPPRARLAERRHDREPRRTPRPDIDSV